MSGCNIGIFTHPDSLYVGIGTAAPSYTLDVKGNVNIQGSVYQNGAIFAGGDTMPVGAIMPFYASTVSDPSWLVCDGSTYNRADYVDLANALGVSPSATTFTVPDLRDKFLKGKNADSIGATGGSATTTLTTANLPNHTHTINDPGHSHSTSVGSYTVLYNNNPGSTVWQNGSWGGVSSLTINNNTTGITITGTPGATATPFTTQPPYTTVIYIIKAKNAQYITPIRNGDYWTSNTGNGALIYQSGKVGIGTTNPQEFLDISGNVNITGSLKATNMNMFRNKIINGDMRLTQRTSNFIVPNLVGSVNPVDRFYLYGTIAGKLTAQLSTTDAPIGFTRSLVFTSSSAYTVTSTDRFGLLQNMEGYNTYDFMFGTANATSVAISFWVKASVTGTYSLKISNAAEDRCYIATYTVNSASTWENKTITIAGSTSGTWDTDTGTGMQLFFDLGAGTNFEGAAGSWLTSAKTRTAASVKLCATNAATWAISGIQLEKGSLSTVFDQRPFTTELTLSRTFFSAMDNRNTYGYNSTWQFGSYLDLAAYNASLKGFSGGFTDGRYAYLVPYNNGTANSGILTRVDLQNFTPSGIAFLDVSTAGNTSAKGFEGGFTDGRYAYLVPHYNGAYHGIFTRVDLQNFTTSGVSYLDVSTAGNTSAKGFVGGFTDGRYAYLVPHYNGAYHGIFTRVDLQNFTTSGVSYLDVSTAGNTSAKGFIGGFTDGRYAYLVPYYNGTALQGILTRVDLQNFTTSGVSYLDVSTAGNTSAKGFHSGFTDGRYAYLMPFNNGAYHSTFTRVDLQNFTTSGVSYLDVSTAGNISAKGFIGGFTDGRYAYLVPHFNGVYHGIFTRVDLQNFTTSGVSYMDVSTAGNTSAKGFAGGFTDGRYAYLVPLYNGAYHGIFTRVFIADTLANTSLGGSGNNRI